MNKFIALLAIAATASASSIAISRPVADTVYTAGKTEDVTWAIIDGTFPAQVDLYMYRAVGGNTNQAPLTNAPILKGVTVSDKTVKLSVPSNIETDSNYFICLGTTVDNLKCSSQFTVNGVNKGEGVQNAPVPPTVNGNAKPQLPGATGNVAGKIPSSSAPVSPVNDTSSATSALVSSGILAAGVALTALIL